MKRGHISTRMLYQVTCRDCGGIRSLPEAASAEDAAVEAVSSGWRFTEEYGYFCRDCFKNCKKIAEKAIFFTESVKLDS